VTVALYTTIWLSLCLFVVGEAGKPRSRHAVTTSWPWRLWVLGALICIVHMAIALDVRHGWSHRSAVEETARQTAAVYGIEWGGGVYVNYLFVIVWLAESWWWRRDPEGYACQPTALTWTLRAFYLIVIVNAAIVFASPARRIAGAVLVMFLIWVWRPKA
jgi:hypothetical protein